MTESNPNPLPNTNNNDNTLSLSAIPMTLYLNSSGYDRNPGVYSYDHSNNTNSSSSSSSATNFTSSNAANPSDNHIPMPFATSVSSYLCHDYILNCPLPLELTALKQYSQLLQLRLYQVNQLINTNNIMHNNNIGKSNINHENEMKKKLNEDKSSNHEKNLDDSNQMQAMLAIQSLNNNSTNHTDSPSRQSKSNYPCTYPNCKQFFPDKTSLTQHLPSHHTTNNNANANSNHSLPNNTKATNHDKHNVSSLPALITVPPLLFICEFVKCALSFASRSELDSHYQSHHTAHPKPYTCERCGKTFAYKYNYKPHARKCAINPLPEVTNAKAYPCHLCNRQFSFKGTLQRHMRSHAAVKAFKCEICSKAFTRKDVLMQHIIIHARTPEERRKVKAEKSTFLTIVAMTQKEQEQKLKHNNNTEEEEEEEDNIDDDEDFDEEDDYSSEEGEEEEEQEEDDHLTTAHQVNQANVNTPTSSNLNPSKVHATVSFLPHYPATTDNSNANTMSDHNEEKFNQPQAHLLNSIKSEEVQRAKKPRTL
jgi:hypothetical protein